MINAIITKNNKINIDPTTQLIANSDEQIIFEFQVPWSEEYELCAVFKPVFDVPITVKLNSDKTCDVPKGIYNKFGKVGIALMGKSNNGGTVCTTYQYVRVLKSPCV